LPISVKSAFGESGNGVCLGNTFLPCRLSSVSRL